jgi:predicted  nucleic acid-binding Zn-ribbon protein
MLDDNLRVLGRRINDLELEIESKKEKIEKLEQEKFDLSEKLSITNSQQDEIRSEIEEEMKFRIDQKEREIRKLKESLQT